MYNLGGNTVIHSDESPNIFIGKKYGINNMNFSGGCSGAQYISFDSRGRPYKSLGSATNNYSQYIDSDCTIQFGFADSSITPLNITVTTETGYVSAN